jgi:hypothetical protein
MNCPLKTVCLRANTEPTDEHRMFTTPPHGDGYCEYYLTKNVGQCKSEEDGEGVNTDDED